MDTPTIKGKCDCINKATCIEIIRLLESSKWEEAEDLIQTIISWKFLSSNNDINDWEQLGEIEGWI